MADVYTVVFTLIGILLSLPALLVALNLLLPRLSKRAETRLKETPVKSFVFGVPITIIFLVIIAIATQINVGLVQGFGILVAVLGMGLGTLGAAGLQFCSDDGNVIDARVALSDKQWTIQGDSGTVCQ